MFLLLPILTAISFQHIIEKGGRNKPWVVIVYAGGQIMPYVVKLFDSAIIEYKDCVTNEVLGNVLAKEFNLPTPKAALIDFDDEFISTIRDSRLLEIIEAKDDRLKFGTQLQEGFFPFDASYPTSDIKNIIEPDTVFAFDNFIRNPDRNVGRTNILVKSDEAFLIDHELAFEISAETIEKELLNWGWDSKFYNQHIFKKSLTNSILRHKKDYFTEFEECLKYINLSVIVPYLTQLRHSGYSPAKYDLITEYLVSVKQNSTKFVNIMKMAIS